MKTESNRCGNCCCHYCCHYCRSHRYSRGFTLLEIMLVMVVIGVMVGLAAVALAPNPANDLQRQGRRLQAVLQMAADEAMMQGIEMALSLSYVQADLSASTAAGYQFLVLNKEDLSWHPIAQAQFGFHSLGHELFMEVNIDGQQLDKEVMQQLKRLQALHTDQQDGDQQLQPALLLLSSGEVSPFTISLRHPQVEQAVNISSDGVSGISLQ